MLQPSSPQPHNLFSFYKAQNLYSDPLLTSLVSHPNPWELIDPTLPLAQLKSMAIAKSGTADFEPCYTNLPTCLFAICFYFFSLGTKAFLNFESLSSRLCFYEVHCMKSQVRDCFSVYIKKFSLVYVLLSFLSLFLCLIYDNFCYKYLK